MTPQVGRLGVWAHATLIDTTLARDLESWGYGAIWLGGSPSADLAVVDPLLEATDHLVLATGIVNVWTADARTVAASHRRLTEAYPGRFLLGIGVGHPEQTSDYRRPYEALVEYLDVLDAEGVPESERVLAALGPKVLRLARDRTAGAHPYLVPAEHSRRAREILGPDKLLAPEHKVVVDPDPERARAVGRPVVQNPYLGLTNYVTNLKRMGFSDADVADGGSDALIDAVVAHGDAPTAAAAVAAHFEAGADHVAVQVRPEDEAVRRTGYEALARELLTGR